MLLASTVLTVPSEGLKTKPYYDPAHILTVCVGDTKVAMRQYTTDECLALLEARQTRDYAPPVLKCAPRLAEPGRTRIFAAALDAAYNAGTSAFCKSRMAIAFNAGRWSAGCAGFNGWYVTARVHGTPTVFKGLVKRRAAESELCFEGIADAEIARLAALPWKVIR